MSSEGVMMRVVRAMGVMKVGRNMGVVGVVMLITVEVMNSCV